MSKEIKAFITNDKYINAASNAVSSVFELSDIASTYSKDRQHYYSVPNPEYSLHVFKIINSASLTQQEANKIISVIHQFTIFLTNSVLVNKQQIIINFTNAYNTNNSPIVLSNLIYNEIIIKDDIKTVDYLSFTIDDISTTIWLSDSMFRTFYPDYNINIVTPFVNFGAIVNIPASFIAALDNFNLLTFNERVELDKNNKPTTYTKILNIPYKVPSTNVYKPCYFAFNIYGLQGNYDYILKLSLYDYLVNTLEMTSELVESLFPSILNINEFFITPTWTNIAMPSQVGQTAINSQIAKAYSQPFNLDNYIKVYNNTFLHNNTYSVPYSYNNILLLITNGLHSDELVKDFRTYYPDLITVTSAHPDFSRMSMRTQHFVTLLENMLYIVDSNNSTILFNKLINNNNYNFSIINRAGITYLSYFYEEHQIYMIPKYEYIINS